MRRFFVGLAIIAMLGHVPCKVRGNDRQIARKIAQTLEEKKEKGDLQGFNIDLQVDNGTVYLQGHVSSESQEAIALDVARRVAGVKQVYNELEIVAGLAKPAEAQPELQTPQAASKSQTIALTAAKSTDAAEIEAVKPASEVAIEPAVEKSIVKTDSATDAKIADAKIADEKVIAPKIKEVSESKPASEASVDSRELAERIFSRLKQEKDKGQLKGFSLDLEVDNGVVWLKGKVASPEQQNRVLEIVRRIPGVTKVVNGLAVTATTQTSTDIARQVIEQLQTKKDSGILKDFGVDVEVNDGIVWLSGYVANEEQRSLVLDGARFVPGVVKVVNDLTISAPNAGIIQTGTTVPTPPADESTSAPRPLPLQDAPVGSAVASRGAGVAEQPSVPAPAIRTATPAAPNLQYVLVPTGQIANMPATGAPTGQVPLAFAPARAASHVDGMAIANGGQPMPMNASVPGMGIAPARFDHPQLPQYSWPSYAPYPNYGAVTYPKQYSPMAWPYIGPFYPYPQVPLGWRKVTLEWKDGWWWLDFKSRH